jgi:hypothetical protein
MRGFGLFLGFNAGGGPNSIDRYTVGGIVPFLVHDSARNFYATRESRFEDYALKGVAPYFVLRAADNTYLEG